jgi:CheY-like chemotaxis protein
VKYSAVRVASARSVGAANMSGATILLADDDNDVREVTRAMLGELGYRVLEAGSGGGALDVLARESTIDLLILDFAMPGMNGAEVARLVRSKHPDLPILFVTGFADRAALGVVDDAFIVSKPFLIDDLGAKVRLALTKGISDKVVPLRR